MSALYNELDPYAAQWLRNLISAGHIAPGVVDARSIKEVSPDDVGVGQVHLFAGIGVWSHALRLAGFPDDFPVWSASCPCQPFSAAGRGLGVDDARHLWPDAFRLIEAKRPILVVGEQVASPDGLAWLDIVFADLEGAGYTCRAVDICAAGFGAPHIRQRLYWCAVRDDVSLLGQVESLSVRLDGESGAVADSADLGLLGRWAGEASDGRDAARLESERLRDALAVADADATGRVEFGGAGLRADPDAPFRHDADGRGATGRLVDSVDSGFQGHAGHGDTRGEPRWLGADATGPAAAPSPTNGAWADVDWLPCVDGKWRPTQPGLLPLAHGATQRVGRLRAYGNCIAAPQAVEFLKAVRGCVGVWP